VFSPPAVEGPEQATQQLFSKQYGITLVVRKCSKTSTFLAARDFTLDHMHWRIYNYNAPQVPLAGREGACCPTPKPYPALL